MQYHIISHTIIFQTLNNSYHHIVQDILIQTPPRKELLNTPFFIALNQTLKDKNTTYSITHRKETDFNLEYFEF